MINQVLSDWQETQTLKTTHANDWNLWFRFFSCGHRVSETRMGLSHLNHNISIFWMWILHIYNRVVLYSCAFYNHMLSKKVYERSELKVCKEGKTVCAVCVPAFIPWLGPGQHPSGLGGCWPASLSPSGQLAEQRSGMLIPFSPPLEPALPAARFPLSSHTPSLFPGYDRCMYKE